MSIVLTSNYDSKVIHAKNRLTLLLTSNKLKKTEFTRITRKELQIAFDSEFRKVAEGTDKTNKSF